MPLFESKSINWLLCLFTHAEVARRISVKLTADFHPTSVSAQAHGPGARSSSGQLPAVCMCRGKGKGLAGPEAARVRVRLFLGTTAVSSCRDQLHQA